eukprot:CAMPEP_0114229782 /NCGR_PEP_ID=MMETSP0058-20121206/3100_1 /TAXON_ID=36894 /ORGANISM="Pyramimonas parkeae, CCMP726" /LENGTH=94 /DNA_ID=CAMNT_0001340899 /DNA_START=2391 /DNA_END=2675 /DNA_ORIENTATION=-
MYKDVGQDCIHPAELGNALSEFGMRVDERRLSHWFKEFPRLDQAAFNTIVERMLNEIDDPSLDPKEPPGKVTVKAGSTVGGDGDDSFCGNCVLM